MALNDAKLFDDLKAIKDLNTDGENNEDAALQKLADAITNYVKSAGLQGTTADGKAVTGNLI